MKKLADKELKYKYLQVLLKYQTEHGTNKYMTQNHFRSNQKTSPVNRVAKKFIQRLRGDILRKILTGRFI